MKLREIERRHISNEYKRSKGVKRGNEDIVFSKISLQRNVKRIRKKKTRGMLKMAAKVDPKFTLSHEHKICTDTYGTI